MVHPNWGLPGGSTSWRKMPVKRVSVMLPAPELGGALSVWSARLPQGLQQDGCEEGRPNPVLCGANGQLTVSELVMGFLVLPAVLPWWGRRLCDRMRGAGGLRHL